MTSFKSFTPLHDQRKLLSHHTYIHRDIKYHQFRLFGSILKWSIYDCNDRPMHKISRRSIYESYFPKKAVFALEQYF